MNRIVKILSLLAMTLLSVALVCTLTACGDDEGDHTHDWKAGEDTATCQKDGVLKYTCSCGETKEEPSGKKEHSWDEGVTTEATCSKPGKVVYTCDSCKMTRQDDLPVSAHTYDESKWVTDENFHYHAATCGCDVSKDKAYHEFDANNDCEICGYHTDVDAASRELEYKKFGAGYFVTGRGTVVGSSVTIPATYNNLPVKGVYPNAFSEPYLTEVIVSEGVLELRNNAFNGCTNLAKVTLPTTLTKLDESCFYNTAVSEVVIPADLVGNLPRTHLTKLTINAGSVIGKDALNGAQKLTTVTIPVSVTKVDSGAFLGCNSLVSVVYGGTIADWEGIEFISSPLAGGVTVAFSDGKRLSIPDSIIHHDKVAGSEFLTQPEYVFKKEYSGKDEDITVHFPQLDSIVQNGRNEVPIYGIFAYGGDFSKYNQQVADIGFTCIRTDMYSIRDYEFGLFCQVGASLMPTVQASVMDYVPKEVQDDANDLTAYLEEELGKWNRNGSGELKVWFNKLKDSTIEFLRRYGPDGTYFQENPDANYNPIAAIETANEPNFHYMISGALHGYNNVDIKANLYAALHIYLYDAIHEEFGDKVKVVAFGCGGVGFDQDFIKKTLQKNPEMKTKMDVISTHPYWDGGSPFTAKDTSSIPANNNSFRVDAGWQVPIWYTEGGWQISPDEGGHYNYNSSNFSTQQEQAAMLVQEYILGMRIGVERIMYMYLMDTDSCNYGVLNIDGSYRKSAYAIRTIVAMMSNPLLKEALIEGKDQAGNLTHAYAYTFENEVDGVEVTVAFSATERQDVEIPWDGEYALLTDMYGVSKLVKAHDGVITLTVGACMQYLTPVEITEG